MAIIYFILSTYFWNYLTGLFFADISFSNGYNLKCRSSLQGCIDPLSTVGTYRRLHVYVYTDARQAAASRTVTLLEVSLLAVPRCSLLLLELLFSDYLFGIAQLLNKVFVPAQFAPNSAPVNRIKPTVIPI